MTRNKPYRRMLFGGVAAGFGLENLVPVQFVGLVLIALGMGTSILAQLRLQSVTEEAEAHRAISPVVRSYVLLLAGMTAVFRPGWVPFLLVFYGVFEWVMRMRPMKEQI